MELKQSFRKDQYITLIVRSIRDETMGVKTLVLSPVNGRTLTYKAGQFLTFVFDRNGYEERRSFSLSGSPELNEPLSITLKRVDNGAWSRYLTDVVKPGDLLYATGVSGIFTLPHDIDRYRQVFFFAAGIGITPVFSLIKESLAKNGGPHVTLLYSSSSEKQTVFYNELQELVRNNPEQLHVEFLYSSSYNLLRARLNKNLLPILLQEQRKAKNEETLFYLCGPFAYMRMVLLGLEEQNVPVGNIRKENFDTQQRFSVNEPPDKDSHKVVVQINNELRELTVSYPDTILQAAKKAGLQLPYSCEAGRCASCVAHCIAGKVWLSYNEVLTDDDLIKGLTLTCTGHPIGGDVTLKFF